MRMKHITLLLLLLFTFNPCLRAQKKELSQARAFIKSGKSLDKAEQLMDQLLAQPEHQQNLKLHAARYDAVYAQYEEANKRFYLKQQQDTAAYFNLLRRLYLVAEAMDSVDAAPDQKGRVKPEYRDRHAEALTRLLPNLYSAGPFFVKKQQWQQAFTFYETYLDCYQQPLLEQSLKNEEADKLQRRKVQAAYWALYSAYRMDDAVRTLRYRELALQDEQKREHTLQYVAEAWLQLKDDSMYVATLQQGFSLYPQNIYFFPRLIDSYTSVGKYEKALETADRALETCDTCRLYLFAKSSLLLNLGRNDEALSYAQQVAGEDYPEACFTAATALLNKVAHLNERKDKAQIRQLYAEARPYMEQFRQYAPEAKDRWAPALYRIYLNLNMGKQFDEIDRLLKN